VDDPKSASGDFQEFALPSQITKLLILLVLAAGAASALAYSHLQTARDHALLREHDLAICTADLSSIASASGQGIVVRPGVDDPELNRRLRSAATIAGVGNELVSIDPGPARQVRDTDYDETVVYLRLDNVTLRQLVTFLHQLSSRDKALRTKSLQLAPPAPTGIARAPLPATTLKQESGELWTADVTLAYLSYSPHGNKP